MMKNLYIPKGRALHYETLSCQDIVNDGVLEVEGTLHARNITGKGVIRAGTISARNMAAMDVECAALIGETLTAERVCAAEVKLSISATVSCYLEAEYVEVPKLTVSKHSINTLKAEDVVTLPEKKRGIAGTLLAGFFRRLWLSLRHRIPMDAEYVHINEPEAKDAQAPQAPQEKAGAQAQADANTADADLEDDFEFKRLKAMYRLLRESGYTLRIMQRETHAAVPQAEHEPETFLQKAA